MSIYATGQVLHATHDWSLVFEVAAGLYLAGAGAYLRFASSEEQFDPLPSPSSPSRPMARAASAVVQLPKSAGGTASSSSSSR